MELNRYHEVGGIEEHVASAYKSHEIVRLFHNILAKWYSIMCTQWLIHFNPVRDSIPHNKIGVILR